MNQLVWTPGITLEEIEKQVIILAYKHFRCNKTTTANALGIAIRTLDNKLEKYDFESKAEIERERMDHIKRTDFLARQRGNVPNNIYGGYSPTPVVSQTVPTAIGVRTEPVANAPLAASPVQSSSKKGR